MFRDTSIGPISLLWLVTRIYRVRVSRFRFIHIVVWIAIHAFGLVVLDI